MTSFSLSFFSNQIQCSQVFLIIQLTFSEFHFATEAKVDFPSACISQMRQKFEKMFSILTLALSWAITSFGNKFCLEKRSRLMKALDNRFNFKFMQLEIVYSRSRPTSNNHTLLQIKREISRAYQSSLKIFQVRHPFFDPPCTNKQKHCLFLLKTGIPVAPTHL